MKLNKEELLNDVNIDTYDLHCEKADMHEDMANEIKKQVTGVGLTGRAKRRYDNMGLNGKLRMYDKNKWKYDQCVDDAIDAKLDAINTIFPDKRKSDPDVRERRARKITKALGFNTRKELAEYLNAES